MEYRNHKPRDVLVSKHYGKHVSAMTAEDLHGKGEIAEELAARDIEIERLRAELAALKQQAATRGSKDGWTRYMFDRPGDFTIEAFLPKPAAPRPAQVPQWQPIETAPKDGKCLVLVETDDGDWIGRLDRDKKGNWIHDGEPTFCHSYYFCPVKWMPLPAAPQPSGKEE